MDQVSPAVTSQGELFTSPDVNAARAFFKEKSRARTNKLMTVSEAVSRFIHDGDYLASGGFGGVRIASAVLLEIVRQRKKRLGLSGHTATHDFQILAAGRCFDRCDIAYIVGLEMRGLSPNARRYMESGEVTATEWTNAALAWRYKAASMGVSFLPARSMLGSEVFKYSAAKEIECPFTGQKYVALPALFPDVAIIHVHRADIYGNCQLDGITIADYDVGPRFQTRHYYHRTFGEYGRDPERASQDPPALLAGRCGLPCSVWKLSGQHALRILLR